MDTNQHSFENFGLQRAAAAGDDEGVRQALHSGADVNALNIAGKTALMSAIAGDKYVFFPFDSARHGYQAVIVLAVGKISTRLTRLL